MSNRAFDPHETGGVTRNPHHPKGARVFALNFDDLQFRVDGKAIATREVVGYYPLIQTLVVFELDDAGDIAMSPGRNGRAPEPVQTAIASKDIEMEGLPLTCGCSMSKFKVPRWWLRKLTA